MNGSHPDVDTLAEAAEGVLSASEAEQVRVHLSECAACVERVQALADVTSALGALPRPTMPEDVATRLDAALLSAASADSGARYVVDLAGRRRLPRFPTVGAVAASVVVLFAVALGLGLKLSHDGTTPASGEAFAGPGRSIPMLSTNQAYTQTDLAQQVETLLSSATHDANASKVAGTQQTDNAPMAAMAPDASRLMSCAAAVDPDVTPLAIDVATFDGTPATVIVFPDSRAGSSPSDVATGVEVWVLDEPCSSGTVRYFARVDVN